MIAAIFFIVPPERCDSTTANHKDQKDTKDTKRAKLKREWEEAIPSPYGSACAAGPLDIRRCSSAIFTTGRATSCCRLAGRRGDGGGVQRRSISKGRRGRLPGRTVMMEETHADRRQAAVTAQRIPGAQSAAGGYGRVLG